MLIVSVAINVCGKVLFDKEYYLCNINFFGGRCSPSSSGVENLFEPCLLETDNRAPSCLGRLRTKASSSFRPQPCLSFRWYRSSSSLLLFHGASAAATLTSRTSKFHLSLPSSYGEGSMVALQGCDSFKAYYFLVDVVSEWRFAWPSRLASSC